MVANIFKVRFTANLFITTGCIITFIDFIQTSRINLLILQTSIEFIPIRRVQRAQVKLLFAGFVINIRRIDKRTVESVFFTTGNLFPTLVLRIILVAVCRNIGTTVVGAGYAASYPFDTRGIIDSIVSVAVFGVSSVAGVNIRIKGIVIRIVFNILGTVVVAFLIFNNFHPFQIGLFRIVNYAFVDMIAVPFTDIVTSCPQITVVRHVITVQTVTSIVTGTVRLSIRTYDFVSQIIIFRNQSVSGRIQRLNQLNCSGRVFFVGHLVFGKIRNKVVPAACQLSTVVTVIFLTGI
ncbi:unknown [Acetobacter sp. CAG:267]|nr:unknown [Acetobacter sp. CAG:267]